MNEIKKNIEKKFGSGVIVDPKDKVITEKDIIKTGSINLDTTLVIGGYPRGKIVEIFGKESSCKTTLALHAIKEAQDKFPKEDCVYIDTEYTFDKKYAEVIGIDTKKLIILEPGDAETALQIVEDLAERGGVSIIVIDSIAGMATKKEREGTMEDKDIGDKARLLSKAMRKITPLISEKKILLVLINQTRTNIGNIYSGPSETTPGGRAIPFHSTMRIKTQRISFISKGDKRVGIRTKVKAVKNKLGTQEAETQIDVIFGEGITREGEILAIAEEKGLVKRRGSWYSYEGENIAAGYDNTRKALKENKELRDKIVKKIYE